jgi:nucleoside-diphosphate-sugar epimerase
MTEEWPVRPAEHLFYAQEKAELEHLLHDEIAAHPDLALYLVRPSIVVGPHTLGAKDVLPGRLAPVGRRLAGLVGRLPVPVPAPVPDVPLQLVHEDDVGRALVQCIVGAGPAGAYNIAGDGVLSARDVARALGVLPLPLPAGVVRTAARAVAALPDLPFLPPATGWAEAVSHPSIMDTTKAKRELGWVPRHTGLEALQATVGEGGKGLA